MPHDDLLQHENHLLKGYSEIVLITDYICQVINCYLCNNYKKLCEMSQIYIQDRSLNVKTYSRHKFRQVWPIHV